MHRETQTGLAFHSEEAAWQPPPRRPNAIIKRAFDLVVACGMVLAFAPLMSAIAAIIWISDGRPILYGHERIGRHGERFRCLKFRTMIREADRMLAPHLAADAAAQREWEECRKLRDDPRILGRIGRFLRRTSFDELPQIFNVIRGEMSVVGPRPVVRDELALYGEFAGHYLSIRPGLTGPWQIGGRNDTGYDERVRLDVDYAARWSLGRDIRIVTKTARMLLGARGAY